MAIREPLGYQQYNSLGSAISLTSQPAGATRVLLQVEDQAVRYHPNGTPTSTTGIVIAVGEELWYDGDLSTIKFIEEAGGAELNVAYYA
jgi:hypothetical protein